MGGQIVDATVASAPRRRNTAARKDVDARWTVKFSRARPKADGARQVDIAIATFGCRTHVAIDRRSGFIRPCAVGDAARHDGKVLRAIVTRDKAALEAWADAACRSRADEAFPARHGRVLRVHFRKPGGKPMPNDIERGNAARSKVRARVGHVPGEHKSRMGLLVRTIGIDRAAARITLVNLACNMKRLVFHERRAFTGWLWLKAATARQLAPCDAQATRKGDRQTPIRWQPAHVSRKAPVDRGVHLAITLATEGRFPMTRITQTLGVSCSNLHDRLHDPGRLRGSHVEADDKILLPLIRAIVDERPTYGYRRITALASRALSRQGQARINHKRVCRLMKNDGLLLQPHSGRREGRVHDGTVIVMRSNPRWCSDALELTCWNGDVIRMAFIIDAHDREIVAWVAACGAGISGSDMRDLMLQAVEKRLDDVRAPHRIEHLSDNGSPYGAKETRDLAGALNLVPCFTPVASPQSNGMSEAFVKTFKRDHVRINPLPDGQTVLGQITGWIEDHNEIHPHSGLQMSSPREFIRAKSG